MFMFIINSRTGKIIPQWKIADQWLFGGINCKEASRNFLGMIYIFSILILVVITCTHLLKLIGCKLKMCVIYCITF